MTTARALPRPLPPWLAVRNLFERLVELPAAERPQALSRAAVAPEIASEVIELLAQHEAEERRGGSFLGAPALLKLEAADVTVDRRGERLGPWRVLAPLGSGGMGDVWEARRDDGAYEARVAIKVLRGGAGSSLLLEHFAQEQRLLARLNHPNIARLLDAGRTADGRPYFVLEAVDGQPIDVACRGLPLAERMRLFLQLADAVAHAHRQQLIHRDLKPANVLVTPEGQVKLLDFGIAQALDLTLEVTPAAAAMRPLTPGYASPEQVRGDTVTAASDLYSLGVLLHVVLTGVRPYRAPPGRDRHTAHSALRAVLEQEPTLPSQTAAAAAASGAAEGDPGVDRRLLAGDLDSIVLKALAKPLASRYAAVELLTADLRAVLAGQPVSARRHTPVYLAGKFVRRHRVAVAASALAGLALVGGLGASAWQAREAMAALALAALAISLGVSTWQARRAAAARDEARERLRQTSTLVRDIVMRYADTVTYLPGGLRMKGDLLKDTIAYLDRLALGANDDPALAGERAKALARLADMQLPGLDATLDEPQEAQRNSEQALALFPAGEPAHRDDPAFYMWWARAMRVRQVGQRQAGDALAALRTTERERALLQSVLPRFGNDAKLRFEYGSTLVGIGQAYDTWQDASLNRPDLALENFAAAEAVYAQLHAENPEDGDALYQLGTLAGALMIVMKKLGRLEEAVAHGRRAVGYRERSLLLQPDNVAYRDGNAGERSNFTLVLLQHGTPQSVAEALEVSARGEEMILGLLSQDPTLPTWTARRRLFAMHRGRALLAAGDASAALPRLQDALVGMADANGGAMLRRRGWCCLEIARARQQLGDLPAAQQALIQACADLRQFQQERGDDAEAAALRVQADALQAALQQVAAR